MTVKEKVETKIQAAVKLDAVPPEKFSAMLQRTGLGLAFIGFGIAGATNLGFPWYASAGFFLLGAHLWSGQLINGAVKALLGPILDILRAKQG